MYKIVNTIVRWAGILMFIVGIIGGLYTVFIVKNTVIGIVMIVSGIILGSLIMGFAKVLSLLDHMNERVPVKDNKE